jgi:hypothetical protein
MDAGWRFCLDSQSASQTSTTWSLGTCTAPTLSGTSGDFTLVFTPGKVATATTTGDLWQMAATATSSIYGTGFGYEGDGDTNAYGALMNWYGQIVLSAATIDWGVVPAGLDFGEGDPSEEAIGSNHNHHLQRRLCYQGKVQFHMVRHWQYRYAG